MLQALPTISLKDYPINISMFILLMSYFIEEVLKNKITQGKS